MSLVVHPLVVTSDSKLEGMYGTKGVASIPKLVSDNRSRKDKLLVSAQVQSLKTHRFYFPITNMERTNMRNILILEAVVKQIYICSTLKTPVI